MGQQDITQFADPDHLRVFMKDLLNDLRALEHMLSGNLIESGVRRIGAEQELVLADARWRPAPVAVELLQGLNDPLFTTELAAFNLEFNLAPLMFEGDCLSRLERGFDDALQRVHRAAEAIGTKVLLTGILPTIRKSDLELSNMTPRPRYFALNDALRRLRGDAFHFKFGGTDELHVRHESVMLEACNTSCQVHFQVGPDEFARLYNIAQAVAGPVLAAAANSPLLFGKRLWRETRIALFQQAVDTRKPGDQPQERPGRVSYGTSWVKNSVVEILREDVARFRVILGMEIDDDPFEAIERGEAPRLGALQLHNSTVYRWMRPCYGICNGKAHLRIENRVLPAGPTVTDEVANAAFWFGLVAGVASKYGDITEVLDFDVAKTNFMAAARLGLDAQLGWTEDRKLSAVDLIRTELLPLAHAGLSGAGIRAEDIDRYLGIIDLRVSTGQTGAQWALDSYNGMKGRASQGERLTALTAAMWARQREGKPVHAWEPARMEEAGGWQQSYAQVDQYMQTDTFTVHEDEVIDLVANLMDWEGIRHVMVEDDENRLVGVISYRRLLRFLAHDLPHGRHDPIPARAIMQRDPITVAPDTPTLDAIKIMRKDKVACLPVVKGDRLVGVVTERDFMEVAANLLEAHLEGK